MKFLAVVRVEPTTPVPPPDEPTMRRSSRPRTTGNTMLKRLLSVFALSLIGLSLVVGSASAATVVQLNFAQLVDESDVIVTARVTDIDAERADDGRV